jgi:hypothetical protein
MQCATLGQPGTASRDALARRCRTDKIDSVLFGVVIYQTFLLRRISSLLRTAPDADHWRGAEMRGTPVSALR